MPEGIFQCGVEHMNANVQERLDGVPVPSHLLLLCHALRDYFVDCRFDKARRDPQPITVTTPVIGHRIRVRFQVANQIEKRAGHLSEWENMLEALSPRPVFEVYKAGDAPFCVPRQNAVGLHFHHTTRRRCRGGAPLYVVGEFFVVWGGKNKNTATREKNGGSPPETRVM